MAVTIKLKNASGSDPSASDLVVGEVAIRTDNGKLFTKKDDNSVAEISGGGIDDGDKGDITVSNSGATFTIDNDAVTYAKIQNVSATNRILGRDSSGAGVIEEITPANLRTMLNVEDGATADQSNSEIKTAYEANSDTNAFTDALLSKLNGIAASATNVTNTNQLTNGAGFITATLTEEQVEDFVGGMVTGNTETGITVTYQDSDGTIDFVVASQTDENFTTTLKNKLDGIAASATNVTNTNQLTNGAGFITATLTNEQVQDIVGGMVTGNTESGITVTYQDGDGTLDFVVGTLNQNTTGSSGSCTGNAATATKLAATKTIAGVAFDGSANISLNNNAITNGAGYITSADGGNAATLDGIDSSQFIRSDAQDTVSGDITFNGGAAAVVIGANSDLQFTNGNWTGNYTKIQHHSNYLYMQGGSNGIIFRHSNGSNRWLIDSSGHFTPSGDSNYNIGSNSVRVANGYFDTLYGDGSNLTGISAGATGGGSDECFYENSQTITTNYTITNGKNAMSAGPITINSGVTVTVGSGENWTVV